MAPPSLATTDKTRYLYNFQPFICTINPVPLNIYPQLIEKLKMSAEEYKKLGNQYFMAKEFEKAIEEFGKAIDASPEPNHVLYSNRSACYTSLKQFQKALDDAKECVSINGTWAKGHNRVAAAQFGLGNWEDSLAAYEKALDLDPANAMAKEGIEAVRSQIAANEGFGPDMGLGSLFNDPQLIAKLKANPKTASFMEDPTILDKLNRLKSNPQGNFAEVLSDPRMTQIMAALLGINMPENPEAAPAAEPQAPKKETTAPPKTEEAPQPKATEEPKDVEMEEASTEPKTVDDKATADALKAEGNTLYKSRKFDEAIAKYNGAWEACKDITYLNNRAAAEYEKGDYDSAIATCEEAIEKGRELRADYTLIAKAFARLGNIYLKKGDLNSAAKSFDKSLTEHRTPEVLNKLRATQKEIKKQEALAYIDPELAEKAREEGKLFFTKGDWPNAVKAYTEMVKRAPEDARGYSNRAAALSKLMSYPDAIEDCNKAIALDPTFIRAYIRKANCQLGMKEYSSVIETLNEARAKDAELGSKNVNEIDQLYNKALSQRFQAIEGETPEQTMERVSRDPEVVKILQDPVMQGILAQARDNPAALAEHMRNPDVAKKINMLIAAGVIRTR